jgi:hypothetical protein
MNCSPRSASYLSTVEELKRDRHLVEDAAPAKLPKARVNLNQLDSMVRCQ